jgi:hypothetical protein
MGIGGDKKMQKACALLSLRATDLRRRCRQKSCGEDVLSERILSQL